MSMKRLSYQANIKASPDRVYDSMLGLNDKKTYEQWTIAFNMSSTWEGDWSKGSKIMFVGVTEKGQREGMIARIVENIPHKFVSILHYGILENGVEITDGPKVEGWANATENYTFEKTADGTTMVLHTTVFYTWHQTQPSRWLSYRVRQ